MGLYGDDWGKDGSRTLWFTVLQWIFPWDKVKYIILTHVSSVWFVELEKLIWS